jgi:hypothetical protein
MAMVRDDCPQGHFLERPCSKKKPPCAVCRQIEDERQKLEEKLFEEAKRRTEELALAQLKQEKDEQQRQAQIEKRQHEASLARMKTERRLMKIEAQQLDKELKLLSFQASQQSAADPSSGPDCDSDSGNESAEECSVDDSSVDSKPFIPLQDVAADAGQAVDELVAVDRGQDDGNRDGLLTRSAPGSRRHERGPCALGAMFAPPATLTTSFSTSASRVVDKKANSKPEDPAATQQCISLDDLLKFLKPFFVSVEKEDWTGVYKLAVAKTQKTTPQQVGTSVAVAVLLRLAQLYLDEKVEKLQEELSDIRNMSSNLLSKASVNNDAVAGVVVAAIIQYVSMVVNAADGKLPATTREFARSYLSYDIVQKRLLPASWTVQAESHKDTETNVEPVQKRTGAPSKAADDWAREKQKGDKENLKSLDELMGMIGLESVKRSIIQEMHTIGVAKEQGQKHGLSSYNSRYDGNPGTGKTTVARLYSRFLCECHHEGNLWFWADQCGCLGTKEDSRDCQGGRGRRGVRG